MFSLTGKPWLKLVIQNIGTNTDDLKNTNPTKAARGIS